MTREENDVIDMARGTIKTCKAKLNQQSGGREFHGQQFLRFPPILFSRLFPFLRALGIMEPTSWRLCLQHAVKRGIPNFLEQRCQVLWWLCNNKHHKLRCRTVRGEDHAFRDFEWRKFGQFDAGDNSWEHFHKLAVSAQRERVEVRLLLTFTC